jgi:hypothetical protein
VSGSRDGIFFDSRDTATNVTSLFFDSNTVHVTNDGTGIVHLDGWDRVSRPERQ